jgi:uncharacterized protein
MRRMLVIAALLATAAAALRAQAPKTTTDPAKLALIRQILDVTKAADQMLIGMEATIPAQRASNPAIPAVFWDRFIARAREQRGALVDSLVPIYDRNFTTADLGELLKFYQSPAGKRFITAMPNIARESIEAGQRWGFVLGQEVGEQLRREGVVPRQP